MLAKHEETGELVALKIMDKNPEHEEAMINLVSNEVEVMSSINHPHIVNLVNYSFYDSLIKPNGDSKEVYYLALELAAGGELFDFLAESGAFSEEVARFYFHQLIDAFAYLNEHGISHRDLKPENLMFDHEYNLKIADFGFSSNQALNNSKKGTINYMAPEVLEGCVYNGHYADLFALGIIIFLMVSKHPPFLRACSSDVHYRLIMGNREDLFWATHSKNKPPGYYSESFKDLLRWMFSYNPMERPSIAEIKEHEWFKGPVPKHEQIREAFELRKSLLEKENYNPEAQTPTGSPDPSIYGVGPHRSHDKDEKTERYAVPYVPEYKRYTQFFSTVEPEKLMNTLALFAEKKCKEAKFDKYEYSATMTTDGDHEVTFRVNILQVEEKGTKHCVEVVKEVGDRFTFDEVYRNLRDFFGGNANAKE